MSFDEGSTRDSFARPMSDRDRESMMSHRKSTLKTDTSPTRRRRTTDRIRFKLDNEPSQDNEGNNENNNHNNDTTTADPVEAENNINNNNSFLESRYQYRPSMMTVRFSTVSILNKPADSEAKSKVI